MDKFRVPTKAERRYALGNLKELPYSIEDSLLALERINLPMGQPLPEEWLFEEHEAGQTYRDFKLSRLHHVSIDRNTLYIKPMSRGIPGGVITQIVNYCREFFWPVEVQVLTDQSIDALRVAPKYLNSSDHALYNVFKLRKRSMRVLPSDGFAMLVLTNVHLYNPSNLFCYNHAVQKRVGIMSIAPLIPHPTQHVQFYDYDKEQNVYTTRYLKAAIQTLGLEMGITPCIYYECVFNNSFCIEELDKHPLHACPICIRKLYRVIGFDIVDRYKRLAQIQKNMGMTDELQWMKLAKRTVLTQLPLKTPILKRDKPETLHLEVENRKEQTETLKNKTEGGVVVLNSKKEEKKNLLLNVNPTFEHKNGNKKRNSFIVNGNDSSEVESEYSRYSEEDFSFIHLY